MVDRKLNDTTYASYTDFIWALPYNADLRLPHGTTSSCDKVSFVDVFSPCLVSRQYKQSERSTTRTKNRGSLKVRNWIVEWHVGFLRNIVEISSSKMNYYRPRSKNSPFWVKGEFHFSVSCIFLVMIYFILLRNVFRYLSNKIVFEDIVRNINSSVNERFSIYLKKMI